MFETDPSNFFLKKTHRISKDAKKEPIAKATVTVTSTQELQVDVLQRSRQIPTRGGR
jgi:hypothetical protein